MKVSSIKKNKSIYNRIESILIMGVWLAIWHVLARQINAFYLPSPYETLDVLFHLFLKKSTYHIVGASLLRVLIGLIFALVFGLVTGLLSGRFRLFHQLMMPVVISIKSTPVVSFIMLALLYIKGPLVPSFCGMLLCFPIIYTNVLQGYLSVDRELINMSKVYRVSFSKQLFKLYLPSMAPYIIAGTLTSIGIAWKGTIAAELISVLSTSIGLELYNGKVYLETASIFAWTIIIIVCSVLIEKATKSIIAKNKYYEQFKVI
jgi:NitT/TauT family transport system permease protein